MAQLVKNMPTMRETWVRSLGWEDPLEKGMASVALPAESHGHKSLARVCPFPKSIAESIPCEVLGLIMGKMCHSQGNIRICK